MTILQHRLLHYRVGLFEKLRELAAERSINLELVHGQATVFEKQKQDEGFLPWAIKVKNKFMRIGRRDILWQPMPFISFRRSDLIIMMQENRILSNYLLILLSHLGLGPKIAYWGHGLNFQSRSPGGLREKWKRWLTTKVDWWFAYSQLTFDIVKNSGFPTERITCLNNAVDTRQFKKNLRSVNGVQLSQAREDLKMNEGAFVGLFCGSLYPDKRIEFLIESAQIIKAAIDDFHLVMIGNGPDAPVARQAAKNFRWVHFLGVQKGLQKALYFRLAHVILNPGLVGLHIVDAFCAGLPLVTVDSSMHSPEIAYLVNDRNGYLVPDDTRAYARKVIGLSEDPDAYLKVCANARISAERYTLELMADNFIKGIENCLSLDRIDTA